MGRLLWLAYLGRSGRGADLWGRALSLNIRTQRLNLTAIWQPPYVVANCRSRSPFRGYWPFGVGARPFYSCRIGLRCAGLMARGSMFGLLGGVLLSRVGRGCYGWKQGDVMATVGECCADCAGSIAAFCVTLLHRSPSYWVWDGDWCTRASAAAVLPSPLPLRPFRVFWALGLDVAVFLPLSVWFQAVWCPGVSGGCRVRLSALVFRGFRP